MADFLRRLFGGSEPEEPFSEEQLTVLLESLEAKDTYTRVMAAQQLGEARETRAVDGLIAALHTDMLKRFVEQMQARDRPAGYNAMALYSEVARAEADLKSAAAAALGQIGEAHPQPRERIVAALAAALHERDYYTTVAVRDALALIDTPEARQALGSR
ncbi:MAG: hypothetical protein GYB64_01860 [Chloroflexi bacterium]|nr:hypothetical protein [Chloroflexota bacterium]